MARDRDLKIAVVSDVDKFDLDKPADELEKVGKAADSLGEKTDQTRKDLSEFVQSLKRVDDEGRKAKGGLDDARKGMDNFKDEAGQSGRESAASFSGGFEDVGDFIQETLANGLAGMGKIGAAAGIAAAVGLGFITSAVTEANEKVKEIRDSLTDLYQSGESGPREKLEQFFSIFKDELPEIRAQVKQAGISWVEYTDAIAQGGPALEGVQRRLDEYYDSQGKFERRIGTTVDATTRWVDEQKVAEEQGLANKAALDAQSESSLVLGESTKAVEDAMRSSSEAAAEHRAKIDELASAIDGFDSSMDAYGDVLARKEEKERATAEATAKATKDSEDSWEDYAKKVSVSVDEYLDELERQVKAQEGWAKNLGKLAKRGVDEGVLAELARLGPEAAPLIAKLTKASDEELDRMVNLYGRKGAEAGDRTAANLLGKSAAVRESAERVHSAAAAALGTPIHIPTTLDPPAREAVGFVVGSVRTAVAALGDIKIRVTPEFGGLGGRRIVQ